MRKQYLPWMIAVFGIVGTVYGGYSLIYHYRHSGSLFVAGLILFILGLIALIFFIALIVSIKMAQKKKKNEPIPSKVEEPKEAETPIKEEKPVPSIKREPKQKEEYVPKVERTRVSSSSYSHSTIYVKQVGYGPLLRIDGDRILDMRNNTYYRFENNMLMQEGYGPVYEIRGNQIKNAFGGYLYELSGNNINKVFGGFYASISGNYITLFDLSIKYETTDSLSKRQILAVAALLFGKY